MIPENITKEHIDKAIQEIDEKGIRKGRHSSTYDLVYNGKSYPPKLVISIANKFANSEELDPHSFYGGKGTPAFELLKKEGFDIVSKTDSLLDLITKYKAHISETQLKDEVYKWELVNQFKGRPNPEISDFYQEVKEVKFQNLIYAMGIAVLHQLAKNKPEELRKLFINLFDETIDLTERVKSFNKNSLKLYRSLGETLQHHQDERSIATYLTFHNSEKYTFYKSSFYKQFCKLLNVKEAKKNEKFSHYLELLNQFIEDYIKPDEELINQVKSYIPNYYDGSNHLLLAQDILYQMLNKTASQNIDFFNIIENFIEQSKTSNLKTSTYPRSYNNLNLKVSFGQGNSAKIPWIAIFQEPNTVSNGIYPVYLYYKEINKLILAYGVSETNNPSIKWNIENPKTITNYFYKEGLGKPDRYGTSFIKSIYNLDEELNKELIQKDLIEIIEEYTNSSQSENEVSEDEIKYKTIKMNLSLNTILYGPPGTGKTYKLKNEYFERFTDKSSTQTKEEFLQELVANLSWWETIGVVLLDLKKAKVNDILEHPFLEAKVSLSNSKSIRATLWGQMQVHTIEECEYVNVKDRRAPFIFNKSQNSHWEIVESNVKNDIPELIDILAKYKNFKPSVKTRKRYVFTTFHQSFSYEDFIEGIKPIIYEDDSTPEIGKQVIYDIKPGLFKQIVKEASADRNNDYAIFIDEINRGNIANIFGELITLIEDDKRIDTANYIPAKLPYSNEDFGVPPNLYIIGTMNTADRSVEALDTALRRRFSFIEMNPEPNKLSLDEFKCGGINLEALLIAINGRIEKLLDKDYCIGHSYFMTIKNREQPLEEIKIIFQNKILPLLQEYFYGDWGKIMLVVGKEFIDKKVETIKFLSNGFADEYEEYDEKPIYNFTNPSNWTLDSFKSIYE